jgi:hypothetical protein
MPIESNIPGSMDHNDPIAETPNAEPPAAPALTFPTRLRDIRAAIDLAMELESVIGSAAKLTEANLILMAWEIFNELMKPAGERNETLLARYMPAALKARDQEIKDRSLDLTERKINFNAAKASLRVVGQLKEIKDSPEDEQTKIEKVMLLLFGPEPDRFVVPPGKENE